MMCMAATGRSWAKKGETLKLKVKLGQKAGGCSKKWDKPTWLKFGGQGMGDLVVF